MVPIVAQMVKRPNLIVYSSPGGRVNADILPLPVLVSCRLICAPLRCGHLTDLLAVVCSHLRVQTNSLIPGGTK